MNVLFFAAIGLMLLVVFAGIPQTDCISYDQVERTDNLVDHAVLLVHETDRRHD